MRPLVRSKVPWAPVPPPPPVPSIRPRVTTPTVFPLPPTRWLCHLLSGQPRYQHRTEPVEKTRCRVGNMVPNLQRQRQALLPQSATRPSRRSHLPDFVRVARAPINLVPFWERTAKIFPNRTQPQPIQIPLTTEKRVQPQVRLRHPPPYRCLPHRLAPQPTLI